MYFLIHMRKFLNYWTETESVTERVANLVVTSATKWVIMKWNDKRILG